MSITPQLSTISTALTDLTTRVSTLADSLTGTERENVASVLFEVERSLQTAGRRLDKLLSELR